MTVVGRSTDDVGYLRVLQIQEDPRRVVLALMADAGVVPKPAPPAERFVDLRYLKAAGIQ